MSQQQPPADPFYGRSEDFIEFVREYLPQNLHYKLNEKITDKHAMKIAEAMTDWEITLAEPLDLTRAEIADLNAEHRPQIRRRNVLMKWKDKKKARATYGNLLDCCLEGEDTPTAEKICEVLAKEGGGKKPPPQQGAYQNPPQYYGQPGASAPYGQASLPGQNTAYHGGSPALGATGSVPQPTGRSGVDSDGGGGGVGRGGNPGSGLTTVPASLRIVMADGGSDSEPAKNARPDQLTVLRELIDISQELRVLALVLKINNFSDIETNYPNNIGTRREKMVQSWFQSWQPSWKELCEALRDPLVGRHDIANEIQRKYL